MQWLAVSPISLFSTPVSLYLLTDFQEDILNYLATNVTASFYTKASGDSSHLAVDDF